MNMGGMARSQPRGVEPQQELDFQMELPAALDFDFGAMAFEEDDAMGFESESDDSEPQRMDMFDMGCKTTLVSSLQPADVNEAVQTSLMIFESRHSSSVEINRQGDTWQTGIEYIHNYAQASILIRILQTEKGETAIMFSRTKGEGTVFQRFYREFATDLRDNLPFRGLNGNAEPLMQTETKFDTSGLTVETKDVELAIDTHLAALGSKANHAVRPQREVTGALLQIVASHRMCAQDIANAKPGVALNICQTMNQCSGDHEVLHNCARIINLLLTNGDGQPIAADQLYRWFHSGHARKSLFEIVAENVARDLGSKHGPATMVCGDLFTVLELILKQHYKAGRASLTEGGMAALMRAASAAGALPERYQGIKNRFMQLVQQAF